jgi:hypothetical protein
MATATAAQAAANWVAAMGNPSTSKKYSDAINAYQGNPMAAAAQPDALNRYVQNTAAAAAPGGKFVTGLNNASPQTWKTNSTTIGAQRLMSGAQKGQAKYQAAANKLAPKWAAASAAAAALPKGGYANAMARIGAALQALMS